MEVVPVLLVLNVSGEWVEWSQGGLRIHWVTRVNFGVLSLYEGFIPKPLFH